MPWGHCLASESEASMAERKERNKGMLLAKWKERERDIPDAFSQGIRSLSHGGWLKEEEVNLWRRPFLRHSGGQDLWGTDRDCCPGRCQSLKGDSKIKKKEGVTWIIMVSWIFFLLSGILRIGFRSCRHPHEAAGKHLPQWWQSSPGDSMHTLPGPGSSMEGFLSKELTIYCWAWVGVASRT